VSLLSKFGDDTVNAADIKKALVKSHHIINLKRYRLLSQDWFLYWNDIPVHTSTSVQEFQ
jgi:hypothetical protein